MDLASVQKEVVKILKARGWRRISCRCSEQSQSRYVYGVLGNKFAKIRISDHKYCRNVTKYHVNICPKGHSVSDLIRWADDPSTKLKWIYYKQVNSSPPEMSQRDCPSL